ncbi:hypothetical protein VTJ04DRAFT_5641 [Mycothermus thermophilus]|uniref:uncharacterized protein n=1 Tax=Humicola insolens TaxID=85995 RepID=UPI0037440A93
MACITLSSSAGRNHAGGRRHEPSSVSPIHPFQRTAQLIGHSPRDSHATPKKTKPYSIPFLLIQIHIPSDTSSSIMMIPEPFLATSSTQVGSYTILVASRRRTVSCRKCAVVLLPITRKISLL